MKDTFTRRGFLCGTLGGVAVVAAPPAAAQAPIDIVDAPGVEGTLEGLDRVALRCHVDGEPVEATVHPDETALELVRERLGNTGPKEACGHGACGACTVLLDGRPVAACLLPATALEGRAVTTVRGLGTHPVQRAFAANDALQCGFCTPGFVAAASAFHDRWRAGRPGQVPTRDEVAAALEGNLCRCGAYSGIYDAVIAACAGKHDSGPIEGPRSEAAEKVEGRAVYTVDVPGALVGRILRAPHAHARIRSIDLAPAAALPGVKAVWPFLAAGARVRFAGQEVAAIAAVDRRAAEAALRAVVVDWEVLPASPTVDAALGAEAPLVYPDAPRKGLPSSAEGLSITLPWSGNLRGPLATDALGHPRDARRIVDAAKAAGTAVVGTWSTQVQVHTALEPHACVARWDAGRLHVHLSTQACTQMAEDIAERWGIKASDVRLIATHVGGGFGAKATLQPEAVAAIELARLAGAPVKVALTRREELTVGGMRPGTRVDLALAEHEGGPGALVARVENDGGVSVGGAITPIMRLLYPKASVATEDWDVVSHAPPGKPFRGPGGPPAIWALEQAIDELAILRGEDAVALRRRWDDNPHRAPLYAWAEALPAWRDRRAEGGRFRRGVGLAAAGWFYLYTPSTQVQLETTAEGRLVAATASQDMGNGTRSVIAHAVAAAFGVAPGAVEVRLGDSADVRGPMSGGSRTTASVGPAATDAATQLAAEVAALARRALGLSKTTIEVGGLRHAGGLVPWAEAFRAAGPVRVVGRRRADDEGTVLPTVADMKFGKGLTGALQVSEVEVDTRLGRVRPLRVWIGVSCGRLAVPEMARSQVEGAVIQAVGYAVHEERRLDPRTGRLLTGGLEDYRIPGLGDVPEIETFFVEEGFEHVRGGAVGLGEVATLPGAASIGNAVRHATGWRPRELPLRPDRVLAGLREVKA